jgi:hypothetical protein
MPTPPAISTTRSASWPAKWNFPAGAELIVDLVGVRGERLAVGAQEEHLAAVEPVQVVVERQARDAVVDRLAQEVAVLEQAQRGGRERRLARIGRRDGGRGRRRGAAAVAVVSGGGVVLRRPRGLLRDLGLGGARGQRGDEQEIA